MMVIMFLGALIAFTLVARKSERAFVVYAAIVAAYIVLFIFQGLRILFGQKFATLGILNSVTSSVVGNWFSISSYSMVMAIIALCAIIFLPLSRRMKIAYWVLVALSFIGLVVGFDHRVADVSVIIFLGLAIICSSLRPKIGIGFGAFLKKIAWIPVVACLVMLVLAYKSQTIVTPVVNKIGTSYSEYYLPWQMTLDVTAGAIKNYPILGVGPNHFMQAYLAYKPAAVNATDAWGVEFGTGFGLIPTFVSETGFVGTILWILFFVFFGIAAAKVIKRLPGSQASRFILVSSFAASVYLWLMAAVSVPSQALLYFAFVFTGIFIGSAVALKLISPARIEPVSGSRVYKIFPAFLMILALIGAVWGIVYLKKTAALAYFGAGVKQLGTTQNTAAADADFAKALALDKSDVFWQARAETSLSAANALINTVNSDTPASTSQAVLTQVVSNINKGIVYAGDAIAYDPTNYYNYMSKARLAELATRLKINKAYDAAVGAYTQAIGLNPQNPSLYLSLAQLQASQNNLDDALKTTGAALNVKSNYLDAVFLLSQIYAAKGDIPNATIAAQLSVQLKSFQSPPLFPTRATRLLQQELARRG